jgi:hypothetical protein
MDLGESDLPLGDSTGDSAGEGSVISCVHTLFSRGADSVDFPAFARALSSLPASQTDFVPPVPVQLSEAVGKQHLYFRRDIGTHGKVLFTVAHTCLALEHAAIQIGEGVVQYSLVLYIDGTSQLPGVM